MLTFDAPSREMCVVRRPRTNTPLQALVLMNDPQFVEAARALASRTLLEADRSVEARIRYAFKLATARTPNDRELNVLNDLYLTQRAGYAEKPDEARDLVSVGETAIDERTDHAELAAWTMVANMIMNLDEFMTK